MSAVGDPVDRLVAGLIALLERESLLRPVDPQDESQRRLWRACELCTYLENRLPDAPDPRSLDDAGIAHWARLGLAEGEALGDPRDLLDYLPYWVMADGRPLGTVALAIRDPGWSQANLWVASLYLFPRERRAGRGSLVMAKLLGAARHLGLGAIRLETEWLWQGAVRFYLRRGLWVANWKRRLSLVRFVEDPPYAVRADGERMDLVLGPGSNERTLISARRAGDTLVWEVSAQADPGDEETRETRASPAPTLALWLACAGWPLIRGPESWDNRYGWCDTGMPEGLAYKITLFEAQARRCGFRVETPRIPGLVYPDWDYL